MSSQLIEFTILFAPNKLFKIESSVVNNGRGVMNAMRRQIKLVDPTFEQLFAELILHDHRIKVTSVILSNGREISTRSTFSQGPTDTSIWMSLGQDLVSTKDKGLVSSVMLTYEIDIRIYKRGAGVGTSTGKKTVQSSVVHYGMDPFPVFAQRTAGNNLMLVDSLDEPVTETSFWGLAATSDPIILYTAMLVCSYSEVALPVVLRAVYMPQLINQPTSMAVCTYITNAPTLNKLLAWGSDHLIAATTGLSSQIKLDKVQSDLLDKVTHIAVEKILQIHRNIKAEDKHNETTHRLVIHEIVSACAEFCKEEWSVEEWIYKSTSRGSLGYGPLDVYFPTTPLVLWDTMEGVSVPLSGKKRSAQDAKGSADAEQEEADVGSEGEGEANSEAEDEPTRLEALEAKPTLSDQALGQAVAQLVDVAVGPRRRAGVAKVCGVLATAHRWLFITVEPRTDDLPLVSYRGEANMRVLRTTMKRQAWDSASSAKGAPIRRPSHCFVDEGMTYDVAQPSVQQCLLAMIACMKGLV